LYNRFYSFVLKYMTHYCGGLYEGWQSSSYRVASGKKKPRSTQHPSQTMMLILHPIRHPSWMIAKRLKVETFKNQVELSIRHELCKWTKRDWSSQVSENHIIILKTHVWKPSQLQSPEAWMLQVEFDGWIQLSSISYYWFHHLPSCQHWTLKTNDSKPPSFTSPPPSPLKHP
jgi:hypothetical protein